MISENTGSLLPFLIELRKRLLNCFFALSVIFFILLYFANDLYTLLALPLLKQLPHGQGLIATHIAAPFFVPFELTGVLSLFLCVPFILYQIWAFIAPALYQHERRYVWPFMFVSIFLFYLGVLFAYFVIFPLIFHFLTKTAPQGVLVSPDISQYLEFTLKLLFVFGVIFEIPMITILLISTGITTRTQLIKIRPYAIVAAFIIGMLLSPPDVLSQTLLAIPLWLLFELGLFFSRFVVLQGKKYDSER